MISRNFALEIFERALIDALDAASDKVFFRPGWQDQDLPKLFRALHHHVDNLAERFDVKLSDLPNN